MPKRREGVKYWTQPQFEKLIASPPANLASRGPLPWRLLAYMLDISGEVEPIRKLVAGRLMDDKGHVAAQKQLDRMLMTLYRGGYVELQPKPGPSDLGETKPDDTESESESAEAAIESAPAATLSLDMGQRKKEPEPKSAETKKANPADVDSQEDKPRYKPTVAQPTEKLQDLLKLRGVHPLYGLFLMNHMGIADRTERILSIESLLEPVSYTHLTLPTKRIV